MAKAHCSIPWATKAFYRAASRLCATRRDLWSGYARSVAAGAALSVEFSDGRVGVVADGGGTAEPGEAATGGGSKTPRPKESRRGGQGSLF